MNGLCTRASSIAQARRSWDSGLPISPCARTATHARFFASPRATDSLRVAVLVDTSQEMRNDLIDVRQGLRGFVTEIDRRHEVSLTGFGGPPIVLVDYTRDLKRLEAGISRLLARPGTGSYLLSAIIDTSRTMRKRRDLRRVIVIITTQGPEFSEISYQTVLEYVKESGAPMHSYVLRREGISPTDPAAQEVELTLAVGTQMTGGRREELLSAMSMTTRLQSLASELNNQYQVVYARPKMLIPPKTIEVGVKRADVVVRAPRVF